MDYSDTLPESTFRKVLWLMHSTFESKKAFREKTNRTPWNNISMRKMRGVKRESETLIARDISRHVLYKKRWRTMVTESGRQALEQL